MNIKVKVKFKIDDPETKQFSVRVSYSRGVEADHFFDCPVSKLSDLFFLKSALEDRIGRAFTKDEATEIQQRLIQETHVAETWTLVKQFGLQSNGHTIVTPTGPINAEEGKRYILPSEMTDQYEKRGTLEGWQCIGSYLEQSSILTLGITLAFATPLLKEKIRRSCGFIISGPSGGGKSTAIRAAASTAGYMMEKELPSFNFTPTGGEENAQAHSGTLWPLDDIQIIAGGPKERHAFLENFAYVLVNGRGKIKSRLAKANGLASDTSWLTYCFAGAEETAAGIARSAGALRQGGATVRLIDIPFGEHIFDRAFDSDIDVSVACTEISKITEENGGKPLNVFLKRYFKNHSSNKKQMYKYIGEFEQSVKGRSKNQIDKKIESHFAFIYAVGALASTLGVLPVSREHVLSCIRRCHKWALAEINPERSFVNSGLKSLRKYSDALPRVKRSSPTISEDATGFIRQDADRLLMFVKRDHFLQMFPHAMQAQMVAKHLAKRKCIHGHAPEHLGKSLDWCTRQVAWPTKGKPTRPHTIIIELED